ncbi:MAG: TerB family tellurite resistance protein [Sandaracinus sp.]|jgi:uncharacterized tellurite resistance protein B-like protein
MKLSHLEHSDRLRLMKFVCAFAWADLEIADQERSFITKMAKQLHLTGDDHKQVKAWMELPPKVEELDPNEIPREHRKIFLEVARDLVAADGAVTEEERENLALLEQLLG